MISVVWCGANNWLSATLNRVSITHATNSLNDLKCLACKGECETDVILKSPIMNDNSLIRPLNSANNYFTNMNSSYEFEFWQKIKINEVVWAIPHLMHSCWQEKKRSVHLLNYQMLLVTNKGQPNQKCLN